MSRRSPHFSLLLPLVVLGLATTPGCEHAEALGPIQNNPTEPPTLTDVQTRVFTQSCALSGCHLGSSAPLGLDLSEGQAYGNTVGVVSVEVPALFRIEPGNPDASYLVQKIEGAPDIVGSQMPLGRAPLSADAITLVRDWIAAGASDE
jgi:hypothetical protein